jgi:hypothetical protein
MHNRIQNPDQSVSDADELVIQTLRTFFSKVARAAEGRRVVIYYEDLMSLLQAEDLDPADLISCISDSLTTARLLERIVLIAPHTPTFKTTHAGKARPMEGIAGLFQNIQDSMNDDSRGDGNDFGPENPMSSSKKAPKVKPLNYNTPLDVYLGIVKVPVLPPIHHSPSRMENFRMLMKNDFKAIMRRTNLAELEKMASYLGLDLDFGDKETIKALTELSATVIDLQISSIFKQQSDKYYPLDSRLLTVMELEAWLLYYVSVRNTNVEHASDTQVSATQNAVTASAALASHISTMAAIKSGAGSKNHLPMFKNPQEAFKLSKHEAKILDQCFMKPGDLKTSFNDIGGLAKTKSTINELIRLPLQRPDIFSFGGNISNLVKIKLRG